MAIIGTLPNNIQNGQLEDATPLMADFNFIVNQVNANASPIGTLTAPAGTRLLFNQAAVPVGWTLETGAAYNDCALRTVNTAGGSIGGSITWSQWNFGGVFAVTPFAIGVSQLPSHNHTVSGVTGANNTTLNHTHTSLNGSGFWESGGGNIVGSGTSFSLNDTSGTTASPNISLDHTHNFSATSSSAGSGVLISPVFTTPQVKFTDMIIGVKS
jgi:hypothetical protein